jgi:hypothetical protein
VESSNSTADGASASARVTNGGLRSAPVSPAVAPHVTAAQCRTPQQQLTRNLEILKGNDGSARESTPPSWAPATAGFLGDGACAPARKNPFSAHQTNLAHLQAGDGRDGRSAYDRMWDSYGSATSDATVPQTEVRETVEGAADVNALALLYTQYVMRESNGGCTIMWHGLPSKSRVETDMTAALEKFGVMQHIEYIYLPLNHWEKNGKCRNKGYAFLHFTNAAAADAFQARVVDPAYAGAMKYRTSTKPAAHQGVSQNLRQILSSPKKRVYEGSVYLKLDGKLCAICLGSVHKLMTFYNCLGSEQY